MNYLSMETSYKSAGILISVALASFLFYQKRKLTISPKDNVIVITGCDSGFGLMTAKKLTSLGYNVIAGCLAQAGVDNLKNEVSVALVCDVTNINAVNSLAKSVEKYCDENKKRLWAIINNAGIAPCGHIDWISDQSHRKVFEVNYYGTVNVIKALLYLLKRTKNSRVINISSAAGLSGFPNGGPYCASKHAVEGMSKCLRQELHPWNIFVCNINPGFMKTPLLTTSHDIAIKEFENAPRNITDQYDLKSLLKLNDAIQALQENPDLVVKAIVDNLTYASPSLVNPVGWQGHIVSFLRTLPEWINIWGENILNRQGGVGPRPGVLATIQKSC